MIFSSDEVTVVNDGRLVVVMHMEEVVTVKKETALIWVRPTCPDVNITLEE